MSDNDEDYMSDKFLASLTEVKPSLVQNRAKKRQLQVDTKKAAEIKRQRNERSGTTRNEQLQESLKRPIDTNNKGFQMLAKMGYKPGTSLGSTNNTNAIKEPVPLTLKSDRAGLGREAALQELSEKRAELQRQHLLRRAGLDKPEQLTTEAYRMRATQKAEERKLLHDIKRCQQTCETLDLEAKIEKPELPFFWPIREPKCNDDEEEEQLNEEAELEETTENEYSNTEQLDLLTCYLRTGYYFCYWCGTRYEDSKDLQTNCPGVTRDEH